MSVSKKVLISHPVSTEYVTTTTSCLDSEDIIDYNIREIILNNMSIIIQMLQLGYLNKLYSMKIKQNIYSICETLASINLHL